MSGEDRLSVLPPEVLDGILRATGLSAAQAARLLPRVCRAFRASAARVAASSAPFATPVAVACGEGRCVLLLRLALLPPDRGVAPRRCVSLPADALAARYDVPMLAEEPGGERVSPAWTTYVARAGARGGLEVTLLMCEYARGGLMVLRAQLPPGGAARLDCEGAIVHPRLELPEGLACDPHGHVYVASVGSERVECTVELLATGMRGGRGPAPTHDADGEPLPGWAPEVLASLTCVRPLDILGNGVSATPWDIALGPAGDPSALFVAVHTNVSDDDDDYLCRTAFPTGGVWRVPLLQGRFSVLLPRNQRPQRPSWAVPPDGTLCRPSALAFSRCGRVAYVASFVTPPPDAGLEATRADVTPTSDPRGVFAFDLPAPVGQPARAWTLRAGWDALACARLGVFPWALAVDGGTGALIATAHGGAAGHCVAQLCPDTGAVRATWRHAAMDGGAPNALALL